MPTHLWYAIHPEYISESLDPQFDATEILLKSSLRRGWY
jgi:hypothetical protein